MYNKDTYYCISRSSKNSDILTFLALNSHGQYTFTNPSEKHAPIRFALKSAADNHIKMLRDQFPKLFTEYGHKVEDVNVCEVVVVTNYKLV
jgi:hypothetical protein